MTALIPRQDVTTSDGTTPEGGVYITVKFNGVIAPIFDAAGNVKANPFLNDNDGSFSYYVIASGTYTEEYRFNLADTPRAVEAVALTNALHDGMVQLGVTPMDFGAIGDAETNDKAAVIAAADYAFTNGLILRGGGRQYAISGDLTLENYTRPRIAQLSLKQIAPASGVCTLQLLNCTQIDADGIAIDIGSNASAGDMDTMAGLQVRGGSGHNVRNVIATGNGKASYIRFWECRESTFESPYVHDGLFNDASTDPTDTRLLVADDVVQGIHVADCFRCSVVNPRVHHLHGNGTMYTQSGYNAASPLTSTVVAFPNLRTRGLCGGGNVDVTIVNPQVSDVDQAMDFSGGGNNWGNRNVEIHGGELVNCGSVGVKFANAPNGCRAIGTKARNVGMMGFMMTGQEPTFMGVDSAFLDCETFNPGYNDIQFDTDTLGNGVPAYCGFYVAALTAGGFAGGVLKNNRAIDKQGFYLATDDSPWALAGATSATMAEPWTGYTGDYSATFTTSSGSEAKTVTLTNGSTTVSWTGGLAGNIIHPFVSRPGAMQYGALCEAPYVGGENPTICEGLESRGHAVLAQQGFQRDVCDLTASGTQSIPTATSTPLQFLIETEDTMGMHDPAVTPERIYPKRPGRYRVTAYVEFAANETGYRLISLYKNASTQLTSDTRNATVGTGYCALIATVDIDVSQAEVSADVFFNAQAVQNSGGALNVGPNRTFRVERLKAY